MSKATPACAAQTSLDATDGDLTGSFQNTISGLQAYVFGAFGKAKYQR